MHQHRLGADVHGAAPRRRRGRRAGRCGCPRRWRRTNSCQGPKSSDLGGGVEGDVGALHARDQRARGRRGRRARARRRGRATASAARSERASARTLQPSRASRSIRRPPTKPEPPVTKAVGMARNTSAAMTARALPPPRARPLAGCGAPRAWCDHGRRADRGRRPAASRARRRGVDAAAGRGRDRRRRRRAGAALGALALRGARRGDRPAPRDARGSRARWCRCCASSTSTPRRARSTRRSGSPPSSSTPRRARRRSRRSTEGDAGRLRDRIAALARTADEL